jgi:hypothetical protein
MTKNAASAWRLVLHQAVGDALSKICWYPVPHIAYRMLANRVIYLLAVLIICKNVSSELFYALFFTAIIMLLKYRFILSLIRYA